jgi:hypothetical protein
MLLMLASAPVVATVCEFLCLPGEAPPGDRDHDCDTTRKPSSAGTKIQHVPGAACRHVSPTLWIVALKRTTEARELAATVETTPDAALRTVPSAPAPPGSVPFHRLDPVLQIPLRI